MDDDQVRQGLQQKAVQQQDRVQRGQIDPQDVEQVLGRSRVEVPDVRQRVDVGGIQKEAAQSATVRVDKMGDDQVRQALQRAFQEVDRDQRGQIDPQDVVQVLKISRDAVPDVLQGLDDARIQQEAARFRDQDRPVSQQEFVQYYQARLGQQ